MEAVTKSSWIVENRLPTFRSDDEIAAVAGPVGICPEDPRAVLVLGKLVARVAELAVRSVPDDDVPGPDVLFPEP